jgi:hypothetical protein
VGSIIIFVIGSAAMCGAAYLIFRFWLTEQPPPVALTSEASAGTRFGAVVQRASAMMAASTVAGVLVLGLGGRLMMRLLAATSPDSAQGRITDAEEIVGDINLDGTIALVVFVGVFGGVISLGLFVLLRRWLPKRSVLAGMVGAGIGGGLLARPVGLIDPGNRDFAILSPTWLAALCAITLVVVYGLLFAVLADRWAASWPKVDRTVKGITGVAPFAFLLAIAVVTVLPALIIAMIIGFAVFIQPRLNPHSFDRVHLIGSRLAYLLGLVGGAWMLVSAIQILQL